MILNAARSRCLLTFVVAGASFLYATDRPNQIAANDNRSPAGELRDGVLTIHLELGEGQWHPESEEGEAFTVYAFGETSGPLQNPGPLIRVPQGTEIHAIVHNPLPVAATVHGLHERPGDGKDVLTVQPGATQAVRFKAGVAGTYYYWASTTGSTIEGRTPMESQLAGALVVDPPGAAANDRVFVIGVWYKAPAYKPGVQQFAALNGKSWPYAERLTIRLGETVHWRWVNASASEHAMHLHGFYYQLDAVGDAESHHEYSQAERPLIVTHLVESGETFDLTWLPERAGRWLFHCHMMIHMSPPAWRMAAQAMGPGGSTVSSSQPAGAMRAAAAHAEYEAPHHTAGNHDGMGGLVLGVTVLDEKENAKPATWHAERKLRLTIHQNQEGARPLYALEVRDVDAGDLAPSAPAAAPLLGSPIILTRGQPVEIEVVNRTTQPTAIHWHGIELESYYDGVPGWTGTAAQTTPPIQPGESFVARMTPPRAGTFIYHSHWHNQAQLQNGIYGPLIVVPPGQSFDASTDKIFLFSVGTFEPFGSILLINGSPQPAPLPLVVGAKYRFRLINIMPNQARARTSLRQAGVPAQWRAIAKDGADLPPVASTMKAADLPITVGETYDFEFQASTPQELTLEIMLKNLKLRATQGFVFAATPAGKAQ
jgi:FtsP/CotA-like multicopper oxidase with cupredoxin domain